MSVWHALIIYVSLVSKHVCEGRYALRNQSIDRSCLFFIQTIVEPKMFCCITKKKKQKRGKRKEDQRVNEDLSTFQ